MSRLGFVAPAADLRVELKAAPTSDGARAMGAGNIAAQHFLPVQGRLEFTTRPATRFDPEQLRAALAEAGFAGFEIRAMAVGGEAPAGNADGGARR